MAQDTHGTERHHGAAHRRFDGAAPRRGRSLIRAAVAAALATALAVPPAVPAGASEVEQGQAGGDPDRPVLLEQRFARSGSGLWPWLERGLGFVLTAGDASVPKLRGFTRMIQVDLDSGEELGSEDLSLGGYYGGPGVGTGGKRGTMAVDAQAGRVFMAYQNETTNPANVNGLASSNAGRGELCATTWGSRASDTPACVAGVSVLDAETMQLQRRISLQPIRVEGGALAPHLVDLAWSPPRAPGDSGKVHLLVYDYVNEAPGDTPEVFPRRAFGMGVMYLVQMDPETGVQDWAVRVDACRGAKEAVAKVQNEGRPGGGAVFRSPSLTDPAIFVGCVATTAQTGAVVKVPLDERGRPAVLPVEAGDPGSVAGQALAEGPDSLSQEDVVRQPRGQSTVLGPDKTFEVIADPVGGRMAMRVVSGAWNDMTEVWWVFDTTTMRWAGTIGIGPMGPGNSGNYNGANAGFDPVTGRLYVLSGEGLFLADIRRNPLGQALVFPEFADVAGSPTVVPAAAEGEFPRVIVGTQVIEDRVPVGVDLPVEGYAGRTVDLDEAEGVTSSVVDGAARGFGARVILISGVDGAARVGPFDPIGRAYTERDCDGPSGSLVFCNQLAVEPYAQRVYSPCTGGDRDLVLAFVGPDGPVVVDGTGARGSAEPVVFDSRSRADFEAAPSRCSGQDWDALWGTALFGGAPAGEPRVPWVFAPRAAACVSPKDGEGSSDRVGDSVAGTFAAGVSCGGEEASGHSYARGVDGDGFGVGEALSSFRVYRDPQRGVVSRVESVARGVEVPGLLRIDTVRGSAESWANGRRQPAAEERDEGYEANCDVERTAGTCFRRHLFGVWTPGYSCGPCGDEKQLPERINRGLAAQLTVQFRQPDEVLARGSANGFIAAVQKPDQERFADLVLNNDLLQTVVPTLEIIRYSPPARGFQGGGPRGRQIIQLAGVEVASSYGIACLLVYDEAANTCAEAAEQPGSIQVSLSDGAGEPLAGGAFEIREDVDADGVLGLADTLLPDGACVTADDGIGTCTFEGLAPGAYLVNQVAAPPGYAKSSEPWVSGVASGEQRAVAFTNVSNVSTIDMTVTDETGAPLSGATFAAYPDPDADGKVAPDAEPAATCTTDAQGVCSMQVPAGSYVLVQTGAPGGLEGIEPVPFTFASGGQVAAVTVVNYPPSQPAAPEAAASPAVVDYSPPVGYSPPIESIDDTYVPADSVNEPAAAGPSVPEQIGGTVVRVIRAPGDALRLFARDPQQAIAWTAALALLCLAVLAVRRRSLLSTLTLAPAGLVAFTPTPRGPTKPPTPTPTGTSSGGSAATALLGPPVVGGAAIQPTDKPTVHVIVATTSPVVASIAAQRIDDAERCHLEATVGSLDGLRAALVENPQAILIVDLGLPTGTAEDVCGVLPGLHPPARTVGLIPVNRSFDALITRGIDIGLPGLLAADGDLNNGHLGYAVRSVADGKICYGPSVQAALVRRWAHQPGKPGRKPAEGVTEREVEVARLAAQGLGRAEIAKRLFVTPSTVKWHLRSVRTKLGITDPRSRDQLRNRLIENGLLAEPDDQDTDYDT